MNILNKYNLNQNSQYNTAKTLQVIKALKKCKGGYVALKFTNEIVCDREHL